MTVAIDKDDLKVIRMVVADYHDLCCTSSGCPHSRYEIEGEPRNQLCMRHRNIQAALNRIDKALEKP